MFFCKPPPPATEILETSLHQNQYHYQVDTRPSTNAKYQLNFKGASSWQSLDLNIELELHRWHLNDRAEPWPRSQPSVYADGDNGSAIIHVNVAGSDHYITKLYTESQSSANASTLTMISESYSSPTSEPGFQPCFFRPYQTSAAVFL